MDDQAVAPIKLANSPARVAPARANLLRMWRWLRRPRRPARLTDQSNWILRDIGVVREGGTGPETDPREAARHFWLTTPHPPTI
jgi:hypothetical protein